MYKSILVPLDGSTFAEHALPLATTIARHSSGSIRLLQVLPPLADHYFWAPLPGTPLERDLREHYRNRAQEYLEGAARRVSGVPVSCDMLEEEIDISEAINREVVKAGADLIVMPSHGRGTLERIWFGSIADTVYRHAAVPVLLARPNTERVDFTHEVAIRKILVALDGTTLAEQILAPVVDLSLAMQAELLLVRADSHERPPQDGWKGGATSRLESLSPIPGSVREHASAYLEAVAASLLSRGAKVGTRLLPSSHPADAIVHAAAGCDLIAMQTHARTGFSRFLHGSVVEDVLNHSTLPLLVSRHHA